MKQNKIFILLCILAVVVTGILAFVPKDKIDDDRFVSYIVDTKNQNVELFWKDDKNEFFRSIQNLKYWLIKNKRKLLFATNGGMYKADNTPQGLYIENQKILFPADTSTGAGNFYLKPNGVFYITTDNAPFICNTTQFSGNIKIKYATQSGPMLVIDGQIHPAFKARSSNLNIRNGVGILPDNKIIFAMSKKEMNFFDFANYFKSLGCKNALYLDGLVSRTYLPAKQWIQTDGNFGVIIGVTKAAD
ncbi:MAG TPA: phosphodiester glycosidase family protein [Chitinophagaceae bacterium]|nr:phosphodiester glycosidase family protein [Chitinophagaceae bacterium]